VTEVFEPLDTGGENDEQIDRRSGCGAEGVRHTRRYHDETARGSSCRSAVEKEFRDTGEHVEQLRGPSVVVRRGPVRTGAEGKPVRAQCAAGVDGVGEQMEGPAVG
jgi:hypothetical protein